MNCLQYLNTFKAIHSIWTIEHSKFIFWLFTVFCLFVFLQHFIWCPPSPFGRGPRGPGWHRKNRDNQRSGQSCSQAVCGIQLLWWTRLYCFGQILQSECIHLVWLNLNWCQLKSLRLEWNQALILTHAFTLLFRMKVCQSTYLYLGISHQQHY